MSDYVVHTHFGAKISKHMCQLMHKFDKIYAELRTKKPGYVASDYYYENFTAFTPTTCLNDLLGPPYESEGELTGAGNLLDIYYLGFTLADACIADDVDDLNDPNNTQLCPVCNVRINRAQFVLRFEELKSELLAHLTTVQADLISLGSSSEISQYTKFLEDFNKEVAAMEPRLFHSSAQY